MNKYYGFTLLETLFSLTVVMLLATIGMPSIIDFTVKMRVDREISTLHKILIFTKNTAVNSNTFISICPLDESNICSTDWHSTLSVFSDHNKNQIFEPSQNERILRIKEPISPHDKLQYGKNRKALIYGPSGHLAIWGGNATFKYCPENNSNKNRGLIVSRAGRVYATYQDNTDNIDKSRSDKIILCK